MRSVENCQVYWQLAPGLHLGVGGALGDEEEESESAQPDDPSMTGARSAKHIRTGTRAVVNTRAPSRRPSSSLARQLSSPWLTRCGSGEDRLPSAARRPSVS